MRRTFPAGTRFPWWVPVVLALPALIPLANAIIVPRFTGLVSTGFIQVDMPYYLANAREHFDQGFRFTYGNPYAPQGTPAIYSQPHILLLAMLLRLGLEPAVAFNLFGLAALFFAAWVAVHFYAEVVGLDSAARKIGLACFFWGGGLLTIAGLAASLPEGHIHWESAIRFDPFDGWWMLNFGRNLVYPTEAYYHGVFLLSLLFLLRRRFLPSLLLAALLSWSHPFAGLSLILILAVYSALEWVLGSQAVSPATFAAAALLVVCHLGYYWFFLNRFGDHRAVQSQWSLNWPYKLSSYVPALYIVGALAVFRLMQAPGPRQVLTNPRVRLFLVWFGVVFALSKHDLLIKPMQPIHFTHGYDWTALFFLGAPVLIAVLERLLALSSAGYRFAAVGLFVGVMLLDNAVWLGAFIVPTRIPQPIVVTRDQNAALGWLGKHTAPEDMVVCPDLLVSYLVSTYTPARSWHGHLFNTPRGEDRRRQVSEAFDHGKFLPEWERMHVFYVAPQSRDWKPPADAAAVFQNQTFRIWEMQPRTENSIHESKPSAAIPRL